MEIDRNKRFNELWKQWTKAEDAIHNAKRNDYTGGKDPLSNYQRSAEIIGVTTAQVMLSRTQEKLTRLGNLLGGTEQQVVDESIIDSCLDISIIMKLIASEVTMQNEALGTKDNFGPDLSVEVKEGGFSPRQRESN